MIKLGQNILSRFLCSFCIFLFVLINWSCEQTDADNTTHVENFDGGNNKISNQNPQPYNGKDIANADTLYNSMPHFTIRELCNKYHLKSSYFYETGDYPKAMLYTDSILMIIQNSGLQNRLAEFYGRAHFMKGDILMKWNDLNSAFQYFYEGKKNIELTHDTCKYIDYASRLGTVCYKQANYLDAAHYFKEVFDDLNGCNDNAYRKFNKQQANLDNVALCYDKHGMADSAIYYYRYALDYIAKHENEFQNEKKSIEIASGVIYGNLATTYYRTGKLDDAETMFKNSININTKKGYANGDAQLTQLKLADLYLKTARLNDARQVLQQIKESVDTLPAKMQFRQNIEARLYKLQSDYYAHMHNPEVANNYLNSYVALKDSIDESNKKLVGTDFNKEFENIENKYAYAVLKRNDREKTWFLAISLIIGAMGVVITVLIWQNGKRLKTLNEKITIQNAELQTTLSVLAQSQEENTHMMKIVSHDLRAPINGIIAVASMMIKDEDCTEEQRAMAMMIKTSGTNAIEFINDLLHVNSALKEMDKEPVDMAPLLQHCVDLLQFKANEKQQQIVLKAEPYILLINRQKIWRVISNLISNAIKFSGDGTFIYVYMDVKPGKLLLSIKDHGIGIPDNLKNEVFKMFTRAMRQGTSGEQSFGLGLAISRHIIRAHNGRIWFETEPGKGTIFFIELPVA